MMSLTIQTSTIITARADGTLFAASKLEMLRRKHPVARSNR
jgi:hypothetical protein